MGNQIQKRKELDKLEIDAWPQIARFKIGKHHSEEKALFALLIFNKSLVGLSEIDQAVSMQDLGDASSVFGSTRLKLETLGFQIATGRKGS